MIGRLSCAALIFFSLGLAPPALAGHPVEVEVNLPHPVVQVGDPLVIQMQVRNTGDLPLDRIVIFSREFTNTYYLGVQEDGCTIQIFVVSPIPGLPRPPLFGYSWDIQDLAPDETVHCQLTFPYTLHPGTETIELRSARQGVTQPQTQFTYTLLPRGLPPQPVPIGKPALWLLLAILLVGLARRRLPELP